VQGPQVHEVRQTFGSWGSQIIRLYNGTEHIEIEWTVGPIPTRFRLSLFAIISFLYC